MLLLSREAVQCMGSVRCSAPGLTFAYFFFDFLVGLLTETLGPCFVE